MELIIYAMFSLIYSKHSVYENKLYQSEIDYANDYFVNNLTYFFMLKCNFIICVFDCFFSNLMACKDCINFSSFVSSMLY